jgi:gluconokinase
VKSVILAIDIGTTSSKGLAVLGDGNVVALAQRYYPTQYPQSGFAEQDSAEIMRAVVEIIGEVINKTGNDYELKGISFSAAMHSIMAVDATGSPLSPLIIWADTRSTEQSKRLREEQRAQHLYEVTGTPVHPMSPLCKLMWWRENDAALFERTYKFISIKEFVLHALTGEFVVDYSIASATGLFDNENKQWYGPALTLAGITTEKLSKPVPVYYLIREKQALLLKTGVPTSVPLIAGASDGCLAQLGSGAMGDHDLSITLGTSGAVRMASAVRKTDPKGRIFNYLLDDTTYICGGATNNGTALLSWYANKFNVSASVKLNEFVKEVATVPDGCDGLIALPFLLGERAPMYNPDARGVFFGVSINHTHLHFQRALLEGICFELKSIINSVEETLGPCRRVFVSGGFTHSEEWVQMLSNISGHALVLADDKDASSLGAAMVGFKAVGEEMVLSHNSTRMFEPDVTLRDLYGHNFMLFEELYRVLEKTF